MNAATHDLPRTCQHCAHWGRRARALLAKVDNPSPATLNT